MYPSKLKNYHNITETNMYLQITFDKKGLDFPTIYNVYPSETFQYDGSPPGQIGDIHPSVHQRSFSRQVLQKSLF